MKIIEIKTLSRGGHNNRQGDNLFIPDGWAVVPDDMETPNFPFGEVTAEEINGVMTVIKWAAGTIPEPEPEMPEEPTDDVTWDSMAAAITEGVNEV